MSVHVTGTVVPKVEQDRFASCGSSVGERLQENHVQPSGGIVWVSLLAAATLVIAPYLVRGYSVGHDTGFHMSWWLEVANLFRQGILHARWAPLAYFGYGEPAFLFYPPLSLYVGGLLTLLLPFRLALGVYVWLVGLMAGFSFYYLCRQFFDRRAALLGALVYVLSPYHLLEAHARCSLAELLVSASLPLLLLTVYQLEQSGRRGIAIGAFCFAAIALTNVPLTVISGYSALAFALALALTRKAGIQSLAKFALAIALGAGLAAFFLLPAWAEKPWVVASVHAVAPPAAQIVPLNVLPKSHWAWALAVVEVGQIILGFVAWTLCRRMKQPDGFRAFSAVFLLSVFMVLPFSAAIWRTGPALVYVQFPWRWLGPMALALSFFVASVVQHSRRGLLFASGVCGLGLLTLAAFTVMIDQKADVLLASLQKSISAERGYLAWPYVLPRDVTIDPFGIPLYLTPGEPLAVQVGADEAAGTVPAQAISDSTAHIAIARWSAENRVFNVDSAHPTWIRVRLFWFPGWIAYLNGVALDHVTTNSRGALLLQLPPGHNHIQLVYRGTRDQTLGNIISLFCLILLLSMLHNKGSRQLATTTAQ